MFCIKCGARRSEEALFCSGCGLKFNEDFNLQREPEDETVVEDLEVETIESFDASISELEILSGDNDSADASVSEAQPQYTSPPNSPVHDNNPSITVWEQIGGVPRNAMIAIGVALILVVGGGAYMMMEEDGPNWKVPGGTYWEGSDVGFHFEPDGSVHYVTADGASDCADHYFGDLGFTMLRQEGPVCYWDNPNAPVKWNRTPFIWATGYSTYEVCMTSTVGQQESQCNLIISGDMSFGDGTPDMEYIIMFEPGIRCYTDGEAVDVLYSQWNDGKNDCDSGLDEGIDQWNYHREDGEMNEDLYYLMRDSPAERVICDLYVKGDTPVNTHHEDIFNDWREEFFLPVLNLVNNPPPRHSCDSFDWDWTP